MSNPQQEIEELLQALEKVEIMMSSMRHRVTLLRQAARNAQQQSLPAPAESDRQAMREASERLQRFAMQPKAPKRTLH